MLPEHDNSTEPVLKNLHKLSYDVDGLLTRIPDLQEMVSGKTVIDVGAYVGDSAHTLFQADAANVIAFEPYLDAFTCMCYNMRHYKDRMTLLNEAAGNGEHILLDQYEKAPGSRTVKSVIPLPQSLNSNKIAWPLDQTYRGKIGMIKIDVEGFEERVLLGSETIILIHRPYLLIEIFPTMLYNFGSTKEKIYEIVDGYRYSIKELKVNEDRWDIICTPK